MFILPSISSDVELMISNPYFNIWKTRTKSFKNTKFLGEISNNWPNGWLGTNVHKTFESRW